MSADYYSTLGVNKNASQAEIKKGYRKMAKEWHPDKHKGDRVAEEKFKAISEAYEVLGDESKRDAYDRYGHDAYKQQASGAGPGAGGFGGGFEEFGGGFSDIFESFFGGGGPGGGRGQQSRRSSSSRGADLRYDITINLHDAFNGKKIPIKCSTAVRCTECKGKGSKSAKAMSTCNTCGGSGRMRRTQGFFTVETECSMCNGCGEILTDPCNRCGGTGCKKQQRDIMVNIPSGIDNGTRVRIAGEGDAGMRGGDSGDLYVYVAIEKHDFFERSEDDLYCRVPIPMTVAVLGGAIEVPSIDRSILKATVKPGSQSNSRMRLHGKGMTKLNSSRRGDMYIELEIEMPTDITEKQKKLLQEFQEESEGKYKTTSKFKKMFNNWIKNKK